MKTSVHSLTRALRAKVRGTLTNWRRGNGKQRRQRQETCLQEDMRVGAVVGCSACIVMASGSQPWIVSVAAMVGLGAGAVIGLLLWAASTRLPEENIVPPAAGDERRHPAKPGGITTASRAACRFYTARSARIGRIGRIGMGRGRGRRYAACRKSAFPHQPGGTPMKPRQFRRSRRFRNAGTENEKTGCSSAHDELLPPFERDMERNAERNGERKSQRNAPQPADAPASHETRGPREVIEQAARDIRRGLRDTDRHGIPSDVPGPGPDPEHSPGAELPPVDAGKDSTPRKQP